MMSSNPNQLADCLNRLIAKKNEIIESLNSLTSEINEFHRKKNWEKIWSTLLGALAALMSILGIILAPVTAGASLSWTTASFVPTFGSAVITGKVLVTDYFKSRGFDTRIKEMCEEQNSITKELRLLLQGLNAFVIDLQNLGMSEEEAVVSTLTFLARGAIQLGQKGKAAIDNYRSAQKVFKMFQIAKNMSKTGVVAEYTIGMTSASVTFGKEIAEMTAAEVIGINKLMNTINKTVGGVGKQAFRIVGFAASFAFVGYDIYDTVKGWKSLHPKINDIEILTKKLESEIQQFQVILDVLEHQND